jgi:hypothetical protein
VDGGDEMLCIHSEALLVVFSIFWPPQAIVYGFFTDMGYVS